MDNRTQAIEFLRMIVGFRSECESDRDWRESILESEDAQTVFAVVGQFWPDLFELKEFRGLEALVADPQRTAISITASAMGSQITVG